MKRLIYILVICFAVPSVLTLGVGQTPKPSNVSIKTTTVQTGTPPKKVVAAKVVYTCPMHPEVVKPKSGKCPKCGMNLENKKPANKVELKKK